MPRTLKSQCPAEDCDAANPAQREATDAERADRNIPESENARTCTYCGTVYSKDINGFARIWNKD